MSHIQRIRTMCPMSCHPTLCGMLAEVEDGKLLRVIGDKDNPDSQGFLCVRGQASREIIDNPHRLLHPLIRDQRTEEAWREASWEEVLERIVTRMQAAGREAVGIWPGMGPLPITMAPASADNYCAVLLTSTEVSGGVARLSAGDSGRLAWG